ncbi:MAG: response regulator [Planctomycetes bacterium]|nr:response regulator [Planctomycetota bacterium]
MPGARILVVEDEAIVARDLRMTLERLGYDVAATVATGGDALDAVESHRPELVLMDISLRGPMDGVEAAAIIRERHQIPVVYLTAHADESTLQRAKITEPFGYVLKPFDERELHTAIQMAAHKHRLEQELRNSRQWLATTLRSIGDAVVATSADGRVLLMNPIAEELTGWSESEAAGRPLDEVFQIVNERTRSPVDSPVARVLAEGMIVGLANHTLLIARDGVERPIDDSAAPIRDDDQTLLGVVLVFRDVSERRRLQRALEERARELEEAHRRKDEFLAMLAHELRNPLAPIRTGLELLSGDEHADIVTTMREQVAHVARLVDDLLDVSRITRGRIELRRQPVELKTVVARAAEMAQPLFDERRHKLELALPQEAVVLDADPVRLTQVFSNLLNNAAKFSPEGSRVRLAAERVGDPPQPPLIKGGCQADEPRLSQGRRQADESAFGGGVDGAVVVRVQDEGIGIAADWLPHVFDLFSQADYSLERSQGGLGIGLTLVQNLVQMHGGTVEARSDGPGRGSEFVVTLPVAHRPQTPLAEPATPAHSPSPPAGPRRILVVDDNTASARMSELLLQSVWGHEVARAHSGLEAIEVAQSFRPEVVLLDIGLPGMNGYEVAERLRQLSGFDDVLLVALTGYGDEEDRLAARQAGFDHYLVKPVSIDALGAVLDGAAG